MTRRLTSTSPLLSRTCEHGGKSSSRDLLQLHFQTLGVHVPNNWVLGIRILVFVVQVRGKYMIIGYLDP